MAVPPERRRPRKGSLERPVSGRIYRAAWLCVAVPLLVAAFSVGQPVALQQPRLPPSFDRTTAVQFTTELARDFPDRRPGTSGAEGATDWVEARFRDYKFTVERQEFDADVPGLGTQHFVNLIATAPPTSATNVARSQEVIAIVAHRDNIGGSPGADYNASDPLPICGGECCSRACFPYGPTGVLICQPPSGCRRPWCVGCARSEATRALAS